MPIVHADIAIVGAGVMGCALARELARRGRDVLVLERSIPGAEASSAAGGILGAQAEASEAGPFLDLALRSRALWPELARALREETGVDVGYRKSGLLKLEIGEEGWLDPIATWQEQAGLPFERLSGREARELQTGLSPRVERALWFEEEGVVDAQMLPSALALAATRAGARVVDGGEVLGLRPGGLDTRKGFVEASTIVVCAGAWTSRLLSGEVVQPVRGQVLVVRGRPGELGPVTFTSGGYLIPRADGRVLVGSTTERVGFARDVTVGGLAALTGIAIAALPGLAERPIVDHWAGFRPGTPDDLPLLGPTAHEGVHVLSGHYRNGILLTPISARLMAQTLCGETPDLDLAPFDPRRFE